MYKEIGRVIADAIVDERPECLRAEAEDIGFTLSLQERGSLLGDTPADTTEPGVRGLPEIVWNLPCGEPSSIDPAFSSSESSSTVIANTGCCVGRELVDPRVIHGRGRRAALRRAQQPRAEVRRAARGAAERRLTRGRPSP